MEIEAVNALYPEPKGFKLSRDDTGDRYIFVHFLTPVVLYSDKNDSNPKEIEEGACIFYDKHSPQYFSAKGELVHDWMHLTGDWSELFQKYGLEFSKVYYPKNHEFITDIIREIALEEINMERFSDEMIRLKVEELICEIVRKGSGKPTMTEKFFKKDFQKIRSRFYTEFAKEHNIADYAAELGLCNSRFYGLYKIFFKTTPQQDIITARINHAKFLLLQNRYTVTEIAEKCGYTNQFHFIRQFKKNTGITPGKYR